MTPSIPIPRGAGSAPVEKVVVVDDEPQILEALTDLLEDDFGVLTTHDAEEALRLLQQEDVAVLITDQRMPGLQGSELLARAEKISDAVRIMITGYADMQALVDAVNEGSIWGYVAKPWEPADLRRLVRQAAERHELARRLDRERRLLVSLMQSSPDGIYFKDRQLRYQRLNGAQGRLLRLDDPERAIGRTDEELLATGDVPERRREIETEVLDRRRAAVDRVVHDEESGLWLSHAVAPVDLESQADGLVGLVRDVSDRLRREESLRLFHEVIERVVDAETPAEVLEGALQAICSVGGWVYAEAWRPVESRRMELAAAAVLDPTLREFEEASRSCRFAPGEGLVGRAWAEKEAIWVEDVHLDGGFVRGDIAPQTGFRTVFAVPLVESGEAFAVLCFFLRGVQAEDRRLLRTVCAVGHHLATAVRRRESALALKASEEEFRTIFELAPYGVVSVDATGRIQRVNRAAAEIFGRSTEDLLERRMSELTHPEDRPESDRLFADLVAGRRDRIEIEKRYLDGAGREIQARASASAVRDESGALRHSITVVEDVTEQRRLLEQLQQAQKMDAIGRLAAGVAHDFNNLLTGIRGFADLAGAILGPDSEAAEEIREIGGLVDRSVALTRQLLAFSREGPLARQPLRIDRTIVDAQRILARIVEEHVEIHHDLQPAWVLADPHRIEQILVNLAVNARDAMPTGGRLTFVARRERLDDDAAARVATDFASGAYVRIEVRDTGIGIPEEVLPNIFEPFFTTKKEGEGTGLGLATVYGIVKQHDGELEVHSAVGRGTTFVIWLPELESDEASVEPGTESAADAGRATRVLVLERDEGLRLLIARTLDRAGFEVAEVADPTELASACSGSDPAIVLAGLDTPQALALSGSSDLRGRDLVLLSNPGAAEVGSGSGVVQLFKPFSPRALLEVVEALAAR